MKSVFLESRGIIKIKDINDINNIPEGFIKIKVKSVGICGSDIHYYFNGSIGNFVLEKPMILGHETAGIAESNANNIRKGDIVAIEPGLPCGKCKYCKTGRYNLCPDVKFFATPPVNGSLREYIVYPEEFVYNASGLTTDEASLAEPMSVGIYATRKAGIGPENNVLIVGSGSVGILTAFSAEAHGSNVTLCDINIDKIKYARKCGFAAFLNDKIHDKYDNVFECSGMAAEFALDRTEKGGDLFLIGMGNKCGLNPLYITSNEITVHGIFRYNNTFNDAIKIIKKYRNRIKPFLEKKICIDDLDSYMKNKEYEKYLKTIVEL